MAIRMLYYYLCAHGLLYDVEGELILINGSGWSAGIIPPHLMLVSNPTPQPLLPFWGRTSAREDRRPRTKNRWRTQKFGLPEWRFIDLSNQ
ncbi:hypothetical protein J6590_102783 [Homalodisca vitripennis]|nr:hypothetical protein J6590_102783 [Homalodisca vitripennis]